MYFLISLKETSQKAIIPQKWILNLDLETLLNYGIKYIKKKVFKVFISNVFGAEPDFHLNVMNVLDTQRPACYNAYIVNIFDPLQLGSQLAQIGHQLEIAELDDSDVDAIQDILDESEDEDGDDEVTIIDESEQFAWPLKPTND